MNRSAQRKPTLNSPGVKVGDDAGSRENLRLHKMRNARRDRAFPIAGKSSIHVHVVERRRAPIRSAGAFAQLRNQEDEAAERLRLYIAAKPLDGDLPLPFI